MIPNKTEDQILLQHFKYYDLEGLGYCNLRNFIKTHERLGVVLPKIKDIEAIFNYYDKDGLGRINYKQFCQEKFKPSKPKQQAQPTQTKLKYYSPQSQISPNTLQQATFIDTFNKQLLSKGGALALMKLAKEIQIVDYNNSNKITIDDFVKVLRECSISLNQDDYLSLFGNYDLFINGILFYNVLLKQLLLLYWNDIRDAFTNELYNKIQGKIGIKELNILLPQYKEFIDYFKFVCKSYAENSPLNPLEFKNFVKYFAYGIDDDDELYNQLLPLDELIPKDENNNNVTKYKSSKSSRHNNNNKSKSPLPKQDNKNIDIINDKKNQGNYSFRQAPKPLPPTKQHNEHLRHKNDDNKIQMNVIDKLLFALANVTRRTLFSFIKHFRYYEDDFQCVSKYDFLKILKDYHIELPLKDVEKLFFEKSHDIQKTTINYEKLFKEMISYTMSEAKLNVINSIFEHIQQLSKEYNSDELTTEFVKRIYSSKNNILNNDENSCKIEFEECLDLFHFGYKSLKGFRFTREELIEFYSFISLLVNNDDEFIELMENEFRPRYLENVNSNNSRNAKVNNNNKQQLISTLPIENIPLQQDIQNVNYENKSSTQQLKSGNKPIDVNNNENDNTNEILGIIEDKLKLRGIRGLMYLHNQFITSCSDLNKITFDEFIKVLQLQHILMDMEDYETLYKQFQRKDQTFDVFKFIRIFKRELNKYKLKAVEKAFDLIDVNKKEHIDIESLMLQFTGDNHPEVVEGRKNCEEIVLEFYDTFRLNQLLLASEDFVNFEIFANYYEYVAFVYSNDNLFSDVVKSNWEV